MQPGIRRVPKDWRCPRAPTRHSVHVHAHVQYRSARFEAAHVRVSGERGVGSRISVPGTSARDDPSNYLPPGQQRDNFDCYSARLGLAARAPRASRRHNARIKRNGDGEYGHPPGGLARCSVVGRAYVDRRSVVETTVIHAGQPTVVSVF